MYYNDTGATVLPGEQNIATLFSDKLWLTNHQLRYFGNKGYQVLRVADITYMGIERRRLPWILKTGLTLTALLCALGFYNYTSESMYGDGGDQFAWAFVFFIVTIVVYAFLTVGTLKFGTSGGEIIIPLYVNDRDQDIRHFIDLTQKAVFDLNNSASPIELYPVSKNEALA